MIAAAALAWRQASASRRRGRRAARTGHLVGELAVGELVLRLGDHDLGLVDRTAIEEHQGLAKLVLGARRAEDAHRGAEQGDRLGGEGLRAHAGQPVDGVLQHAGDAVVVFRADEDDAVGLEHGLLCGLHLVGKTLGLEVGVVERPVADLDRVARGAGRQPLDEGLQRQAVQGRLAQAAAEATSFRLSDMRRVPLSA